ncbi:MAG: ykoD [Burkholderiaceae bacterium]|nr:ykoD [Burkholderiaceae bacterium]
MNCLPAFEFSYARTATGIHLPAPLSLPATGLIWLTGASGAGKSTLLNLIKGLHPEFIHGTLSGGNPAIAPDALYLSQNPHTQIVHERVGEEFFFSLEHRQDSPSEMHTHLKLLAQFGLADFEMMPTAKLSHGQAQRLLLASMLATDPKVLLLDEPTAFLDPQMRADFYRTLHTLKQNACVILIDHHREAVPLVDICWYINERGVIRELPVAQYLDLTSTELEHERAHPQSFTLPDAPSKITLNLSNLVIGYDKKNPLFSIAHATLQSGECAVLCGDNGSGKSTLLNTLAGLLKPLSGEIDLTASGLSVKPRVQMMYVFQHPDSHFFFDTVAEELTQLGVTDVPATLTQFGLDHCAKRSPHQLSEGQKRRLTLLFPILLKKSLIILDEPTFGQDALNAERITRLIQSFKSAGYALIVITHDPVLHQAIADQTWRIRHQHLEVIEAVVT